MLHTGCSKALPMLIDLSPSEAIDQHVRQLVRACFADFGRVHLDPAEGSLRVHLPDDRLGDMILRDGVLATWERVRHGTTRLAEALDGQKELRLRLIRAADMHIEHEAWLRPEPTAPAEA